MKKKILYRIFVVSIIFLVSSSLLTVHNAKAQEEYEWVSKTAMPTNRYNFGLAVVDNKIFAIGGTSSNGTTTLATNEMYDPETDTWTNKTPIPTARSRFAITTCQNKIYAITGGKSSGTYSAGGAYTLANEVYDPETDTWETKTPLNSQYPRHWINAHTINNKIYVVSGATTEFILYSPSSFEVNIYDPNGDSWTYGTPIPHPVERYASAVFEDRIYVFGGMDWNRPDQAEYGKVYDKVQIYDPSSDSWSFGVPMSLSIKEAHAGATSGLATPKGIYILGGLHNGDQIYLNQIYHPEMDTWTNGIPIPEGFIPSEVVVTDDVLYAMYGNKNFKYLPVELETPTPTPSPEPEPFPITIAVTSIGILAMIGMGILVYFKKYRK